MSTVASLGINFSTNMAQVVKDFDKTRESVGKAAEGMSKSLETLKTAFEAFISFEVLKRMGDFVTEQMEVITANERLARSLGMTYSEFEDLNLTAKESGVAVDMLTSKFGFMEKSIFSAAEGQKKFITTFEQLGLNVQALLKMSPEKQFEAIGQAISKIENPTIRAGLAAAIFGKNAMAMNNIFIDMKAHLADVHEFNEKWKNDLNDIDARKVEEASIAMNRVHEAMEGVSGAIGLALAPAITGIATAFLNASGGAKAWENATNASLDAVAKGIDVVRNVLESLHEVWATVAPALMVNIDVATGNWSKAAQDMKDAWSAGADLVNVFGKKNGVFADGFDPKGTQNALAAARNKAQADAAAFVKNAGKGGGITPDLQPGAAAEALNKALERQKALLKSIVGPGLELQQTMKDLNLLYKDGKITGEQYNEALAKIQLQMAELDKTAQGGFAAGMLKVKMEMQDVGNLAEQTIVDGFHKAEDALVQFAMTGKASFKDMANSIISDLIRIQIRQAENAIFSKVQGAGGLSGIFSSLFGGGSSGITIAQQPGMIPGSALPSFAVGTDYVPHDMIAQIHQGEAIVPASQNTGGASGATYYIDAKGADQAGMARLEAMIVSLNGSIEKRALGAVADKFKRSNTFGKYQS